MAVVRQHSRGDVSCDDHYGLVAHERLRKLRDRVMPQIVEAQTSSRACDLTDVAAAFFISARDPRVLEAAAAWAMNRPSKIAPS